MTRMSAPIDGGSLPLPLPLPWCCGRGGCSGSSCASDRGSVFAPLVSEPSTLFIRGLWSFPVSERWRRFLHCTSTDSATPHASNTANSGHGLTTRVWSSKDQTAHHTSRVTVACSAVLACCMIAEPSEPSEHLHAAHCVHTTGPLHAIATLCTDQSHNLTPASGISTFYGGGNCGRAGRTCPSRRRGRP